MCVSEHTVSRKCCFFSSTEPTTGCPRMLDTDPRGCRRDGGTKLGCGRRSDGTRERRNETTKQRRNRETCTFLPRNSLPDPSAWTMYWLRPKGPRANANSVTSCSFHSLVGPRSLSSTVQSNHRPGSQPVARYRPCRISALPARYTIPSINQIRDCVVIG